VLVVLGKLCWGEKACLLSVVGVFAMVMQRLLSFLAQKFIVQQLASSPAFQ
jgi:hypothetical protein